MPFPSVLAFLSVILMTQAAKEDIAKELDRTPISDPVYILSVESEASVQDIVDSFVGIPPRHSFMVIGENRYVFVINETDVTKLRQLTFPAGSIVTQYPAIHGSDFFRMFGVEHGWEESDTKDKFKDVVLIMGETEIIIPQNTPTAKYKASMAQFAQQYVNAHAKATNKVLMYSVLASYPPKLVYFLEMEDNVVQNIVKQGSDAIGGPGNRRTYIKHIVKL